MSCLRNFCVLLLVVFNVFFNPQYLAYSQKIGGVDISSVNIDRLTDSQLEEYLDRLKTRGISQADAEVIARQKGVSESQIQKLRARLKAYQSSNKGGGESIPESRVAERAVSGSITKPSPNKISDTDSNIFGAEIFRNENLTFAPNLSLPTPENYVLGTGDEILIDLWGSTKLFFRLVVSSEGVVRPENTGPIYVNGLTIKQASNRLIDQLSQVYSGLKSVNGNEPSIFYQVSLGQIRTISVEIIGAVELSGTFSLPSLATVYTALQASGGPSEAGTFRNVRLIRNNKIVTTVDLYDYLVSGMKTNNLTLKDGDVILVPNYQTRVDLKGEIRIPGYFETKDEETIQDVLRFAGGFSSQAYRESITLKRNGEKQRHILDVAKEQFEIIVPQDGDIVEVSRILQRFNNRVLVQGAVLRPGEFELTNGLTLKQLIEKSDGLRGDAFVKRATIYRTNEDFSQSTIPVDLGELLNGSIPDIRLLREDIVRVPSIYDLREEYFVQINGEVLEGGVYPYFQGMTVEDLIVLSKGLKESASGAIIEISRRNKGSSVNSMAEIISISIDISLSLANEDKRSVLQPFDQVYVRKSPGYTVQEQVAIEGEVLAPGEYTIQKKDERISDLLERAKGLTPYAYPPGAILIRRTEFSNPRSKDVINQLFLQELRKKILSNESSLKSIDQIELIERLNKIESLSYRDNENDLIGSRIKKDLIEDITEQDSLIRDIKIVEEEPVAIDLDEILKNPGSKYDLIVRPGDVISIPGKLETVRLAGEVTSPLNVRYDKSYSFKDYIYQSGGFLESAKRGRSYVQYPNGERKGVKRFLWFKKYPKVEPGSTIFVSRKKERQGINFQAIIAAAGSVATLALVIDRLSSN